MKRITRRIGGVCGLFLPNKSAAGKALGYTFSSLPLDFGVQHYTSWSTVVEYLDYKVRNEVSGSPTVHVVHGAIPCSARNCVRAITPVPGLFYELRLSSGRIIRVKKIDDLPTPPPGMWTWETEGGVVVHLTPQGFIVDFRRLSTVCAAEILTWYADFGGELTQPLREILMMCLREFEHLGNYPRRLLKCIRNKAGMHIGDAAWSVCL